MQRRHYCGSTMFLLALLVFTIGSANASMLLTPAGTAAGFTLSTFADGFPTTGFCCGPLGVAFPKSGGVMVADYPGNVYLFPTDTDGQHAGSVTPVTGYSFAGPADLASIGGKVYMTDQAPGLVVQLNDNGTLNHLVTSIPVATGMAADPTNGLLYVSNLGDIFAVNPTTGTTAVFAAAAADGLTIDTTTQILYAEVGGHILGFRISDGAQVFDSGFIGGGPDGAAVGEGKLAGNIFVNTNGGTVVEVNIATDAQTLLAAGGSRGDFVSLDPNGSLFLSQTDEVLRLSPPAGGCFGANCGATVPEPSSGVLMFSGLGLIYLTRRLRRRA
jgi:hypothetical protein